MVFETEKWIEILEIEVFLGGGGVGNQNLSLKRERERERDTILPSKITRNYENKTR